MKADDRFNQLVDWMDGTVVQPWATLLVGPEDRYAFKAIELTLGGFPEMLGSCFVGQWTRKTAVIVDGKLIESPDKLQ